MFKTTTDTAAIHAARTTTDTTTESQVMRTIITAAARAGHEANRAYCIALGDCSQRPWDETPDWHRTSLENGVRGVLAGNGPAESHACWLKEKSETGWKYGPVKDLSKKEHPCFVPYEELPPKQRQKDSIFVATVRAVLAALMGAP